MDDTALAIAFSSSMKTSVIPNIDASGQFITASQSYLDSKEIQYHLRMLHTDKHAQEEEEEDYDAVYMSKHIPIFLFSLDEVAPVLIDKYYQAKALADMVLIAQTNFPFWDSRISCNNKNIPSNMR
jgi:hypothetical protein